MWQNHRGYGQEKSNFLKKLFEGRFVSKFLILNETTEIPRLVLFFGPQATALFEKPH